MNTLSLFRIKEEKAVKICITGAGATGLTAAYKLAAQGFDVTVLEKDKRPGGLVGATPVGATKLDDFYHHIFTNDVEITGLVDELGLSPLMKWAAPKNGIYIEGKLRPFTSPLDLLKFNVMPLASRISTGLLVLKARAVKNWKDFENINAKDWLIKNAGAPSYDKLWSPLLKSKFGNDADSVSAVWIWNKFKLRGSSRGKNISSEMLGYMEGSFSLLYDKLVERITSLGGKVCFDEEVRQISRSDNGDYEVLSTKRTERFDIVLAATSPSILAQLAPGLPDDYRKSISDIRYKSDICIMLELKEKLSPYYWITVAEKDSPFVLVIEHTNLFPDGRYGSNIVYLSRYLDEKDELYKATDDEIETLFIDTLSGMFPAFNKAAVKACHVSRARYAQPVVTLGYSKIKPEYASPFKNLYLASMAQIYPEDRGQNYAIKSGIEVAEVISNANKSY